MKWSPTPFTLKSGAQSHVYVFGREDITDNPTLLIALGQEIRRAVFLAFTDATPLTDSRIPCLIGIPTAGTPLAQAASMVNLFQPERNPRRHWDAEPWQICFRIMRETKKKHGAHQGWVNGAPDTEKHFYCVVDNVVTDGQSKIETAKHLLEDGYPAYDMPQIILVARNMRVVHDLHACGFKHIVVLFTLKDIINGYAEHCYWTPEAVKQALSEFAE